MQDGIDLVRDREAVGDDLTHLLRLCFLQRRVESRYQVEDADILQHDAGTVRLEHNPFRTKGEHVFLGQLPLLEMRGGILELLILHELADQVPARVLLFFFQFGPLLDRQKHPALYHHERCGHHDKLTRDVEIEHAHEGKVFHVLGGDPLDGDVVNVDLFFLDKVEKQIKRPLEDLQFNLVLVLGHRQFSGYSRL